MRLRPQSRRPGSYYLIAQDPASQAFTRDDTRETSNPQMYYYIFDLKKCRKNSQVADIKNYLAGLGISGEFTYPSAAATVEELVDLGLSKKYNTIVGIGGDEIANRIATRMVGQAEAMGLVPLEASADLTYLIGTSSWKEAAENLRYRKISEMKIGLTANGSAFLTNLHLDLKNPTEVTLEFRDYLVQARATSVVISNFSKEIEKISSDHLDVVMKNAGPKQTGVMAKITSFFGGADEKIGSSLFRARSLRLFTSSQINLLNDGYSVAKTPQLVESSDEDLRLITSKKTVG